MKFCKDCKHVVMPHAHALLYGSVMHAMCGHPGAPREPVYGQTTGSCSLMRSANCLLAACGIRWIVVRREASAASFRICAAALVNTASGRAEAGRSCADRTTIREAVILASHIRLTNGEIMDRIDDNQQDAAENGMDEQANRWVWWCHTRHYFAPAVKSNILARLQPPRGRSFDPDAFLDREMPFFNMAVHALCDQPDNALEAACFVGVYWYNANIKAMSREQDCARGTIYNRARRFARQAQLLSIVIRKAHESFTSEKCSNIVVQNSCIQD